MLTLLGCPRLTGSISFMCVFKMLLFEYLCMYVWLLLVKLNYILKLIIIRIKLEILAKCLKKAYPNSNWKKVVRAILIVSTWKKMNKCFSLIITLIEIIKEQRKLETKKYIQFVYWRYNLFKVNNYFCLDHLFMSIFDEIQIHL